MRKLFLSTNLPWFTLGAGLVGAAIRAWLYAAGTDQKGLLVSTHPGHALIWVLSALTAALLLLGTKDLKQAPKYSFNFPAQKISAVGAGLAGVGLLICSIAASFRAGDAIAVLDIITGLISGVILGFLALCRLKGRHPNVTYHAVICVYLMIHLVCQYRQWSAEPQIQNYCFSLLSVVCILFSNYYSATFDANAGRRRPHALFHLASVYFCLISIPHCDDPVFYGSMAVWMFTDLCNLTPMPKDKG